MRATEDKIQFHWIQRAQDIPSNGRLIMLVTRTRQLNDVHYILALSIEVLRHCSAEALGMYIIMSIAPGSACYKCCGGRRM